MGFANIVEIILLAAPALWGAFAKLDADNPAFLPYVSLIGICVLLNVVPFRYSHVGVRRDTVTTSVGLLLVPMLVVATEPRETHSRLLWMSTVSSLTLAMSLVTARWFLGIADYAIRRLKRISAPASVVALNSVICLAVTNVESASIGWSLGYGVTHQALVLLVLDRLPENFSMGEANIACQGFSMMIVFESGFPVHHITRALFVGVIGCIVMLHPLLDVSWFTTNNTRPDRGATWRRSLSFYGATVVLIGLSAYPWVSARLGEDLFIWIIDHVLARRERVLLCVAWVLLLGSAAVMQPKSARRGERSSTVIRKIFHGLAVCMFIPAVVVDINFLRLAFAVATSALVYLEAIRYYNLKPFGRGLSGFMQQFIDDRDAGPAITTHIYLLLGCALPVWLSALLPHSELHRVSACAGILIVGVGDSLASIAGSRWGSWKWPGTRKSLQGTAAAIIGTLTVALAVSEAPSQLSYAQIVRLCCATLATCLLEAVTQEIDNLVLPLYFLAVLNL